MPEKKWTYHLFTVCTTELSIMLLGLQAIDRMVSSFIFPLIAGIQDVQLYEFWYWVGFTVLFIIPSAAVLLYMRVTDRAVLAAFALRKGAGRAFAIGSLAGVASSMLCILLAAAEGCLTLSFSGFTPLVVPLVFCGFFTCACEELLCRGYAFEYLKKRYPVEVAAAAGSVLFIFHHAGNMTWYGFNAFFALNVFLYGLIFVLVMLLTGSIWGAFGMHTLWNFNQQFIMGLPNSGASSSLSIFKGENAVNGFFFDTVFGLEGAPGMTLVFLMMLAVLYALYRKRQIADPI